MPETPQKYIDNLPDERKEFVSGIRKVILDNIPAGFSEEISYGCIGYVVPLSKYPKGLHSNPGKPLPLINLASKKNYVTLHHMGLYADKGLMDWYTGEYKKEFKSEPDLGKGCIRFKTIEKVPFRLIGELVRRISADEWISSYERMLHNRS